MVERSKFHVDTGIGRCQRIVDNLASPVYHSLYVFFNPIKPGNRTDTSVLVLFD